MIQIILLNLLLRLPILALALNPVPQSNGDCPSYTMKSGDYCVPKKRLGGGTTNYIVRNGSSCPFGYFKEGNYCWKGDD
jgi:hypothetical protein